MAAPTKAKREKREKIKELGLFVRNSYMYEILEEGLKDEATYIFSELCKIRALEPSHNNDVLINKQKNIDFHTKCLGWEDNEFSSEYEKINTNICAELNNIDTRIYDYFQHVWYEGVYKIFYEFELIKRNPYEVHTKISRKLLVELLGESRVEEIIQVVYKYFSDDNKFIEMQDIGSKLTKEEKSRLYGYFSKPGRDIPKTIVYNRMNFNNTTDFFSDIITNSIFLELDFTKPLDELIRVVKKIKNDLNDNPQVLQNIHNILGVANSDNDERLYKTNNIKPISGRLSDILFIYDCRKEGIDNDYILNEINKYWTETKNLFKDKMQLKTLREYHNLAIDYIDNEKYKCYLSGYDILKEK